MRLNEVLRENMTHRGAFGGGGDSRKLSRDLKTLAGVLTRLSWITVAMIIAVFVVELGVTVIYLKQPAVLVGLAGAVGLTIAGAIKRMSRIQKELGQTTLLLVLSDRLTPEQSEKVVSSLVDQLDTRPSSSGRQGVRDHAGAIEGQNSPTGPPAGTHAN
jgi:hypothetical protein